MLINRCAAVLFAAADIEENPPDGEVSVCLVSSITSVFYYLCLLLLVVALPVPARAGDPLVELGEQLFTSSG